MIKFLISQFVQQFDYFLFVNQSQLEKGTKRGYQGKRKRKKIIKFIEGKKEKNDRKKERKKERERERESGRGRRIKFSKFINNQI